MQRFIFSIMLVLALVAIISMMLFSNNPPLETSTSTNVEVSNPPKPTTIEKPLAISAALATAETTVQEKSIEVNTPVVSLPNLESIEMRQNYYEQQLNQTPTELWQRFQALQAENTENAIMARQLIAMALPLRLREIPDQDVYQALADLLEIPETTPYGQVSQIAQILGQAATPPALIPLVENALRMGVQQETRIPILQAIERSTRLHWNEQNRNEDLSAPLETAWQQVQDSQDVALLKTLGMGLAEVGAASGVQRLFDTLEPVNQWSVERLQRENKVSALVALQAFDAIRNPSALPILKEILSQAPDGSLSQQAAKRALEKS